MTKDLIIIILGVWVALVPFLGFPNQWDTIIFVFSGFAIVACMLLLRRELTHRFTDEGQRVFSRRENSFIENGVRSVSNKNIVSPTQGRSVAINHEEDVSNAEDSKTENS